MAQSSLSKNLCYQFQLYEYFVCKYSFHSVIVETLKKQDEVWIANIDNPLYKVIRITTSNVNNDELEQIRVQNYVKAILNSHEIEISDCFLDIHISNDNLTDSIYHNIICLSLDHYSGVEINSSFPDIKEVIHDIDNIENELKRCILNINDTNKKFLKKKRLDSLFHRRIKITDILILFCVLLFIISLILSKKFDQTSSFIVLGANYNLFTVGLKEYWRLFTSAFLHSSFMHLLMNSISLYYLGNYIENKYGKVKYLIILFVSIIISSLTFSIFTINSIAVGLSGGIYALFIIYIVDAIKHGLYRNKTFLFMVLINVALNFAPNVAWQVHLGGALSGFLFYFMFNDKKINYNMIILLFVVLSCSIFSLLTKEKISTLYPGTDNNVIKTYYDLGFEDHAKSISIKLYNYYIEEGE